MGSYTHRIGPPLRVGSTMTARTQRRHDRDEPVSDIFPSVFSFFLPRETLGAAKTTTPIERLYRPNCHDTTHVFSLTGRYTHYNYCHLVVCCMRFAVAKNDLVTLTRGGA